MKFRFGLVVGLAAGYVLGTRAGYERYQQIQSAWQSVRRSDPAQRFTSEARTFADRAGTRLEQTASRGMEQLSDNQGSASSGTQSGGSNAGGSSSSGSATGGQSGSGASSEMDRMRLRGPRF